MPTPYRGRVEIKCLEDQCMKDRSKQDVGPVCFGCELSVATVIDLDDKPIDDLKKPKAEKNQKGSLTIKQKED